MYVKKRYGLYKACLVLVQPLFCSEHRQAITTYLEKLNQEKTNSYYDDVARSAVYKSYQQKQAALDLSVLAGIGYGINTALKRYAPALEQTAFDYQHISAYGPQVATFISTHPWIYPACAVGVTAGLAVTYLNNVRKKAHLLDTKTQMLIKPFEDERLRSRALCTLSAGLFHDADIIGQENSAIANTCRELALNYIQRSIEHIQDRFIPEEEEETDGPSLKKRIATLKDQIEIYVRAQPPLSETASSMIAPQRILAGTLLLGALTGNAAGTRATPGLSEVPRYTPRLSWPSPLFAATLSYAAYTHLSEWNYTDMYKKIADILKHKAEKSHKESIDTLTDFGITAITKSQEENREQGYLVELLGKDLFEKLKKMHDPQKKDSLLKKDYRDILDMTQNIVDSLFPVVE